MRVGDLAAATGLTVRTLHHYDSLGLVVPSGRTAAGHREYGPGDVRRLWQVVALRRLGLSLDEIGAVLDGGSYDAFDVLRRQLAETDRRLAAERSLRDRLAALLATLERGEQPTTDDLLRAVEATVMVERHYTTEQLETIAQRRDALGPEGMERAQRDWEAVYADLDALRSAGLDPADPRAQEVGARAKALIEAFTGGDAAMAASLKRVYENEDPETVSRGMVTPERVAYMQAILAAAGS